MADNTLQQENKSIATEDIAGNQVQRMKMVAGDFGTDDGDVSETNPMPVATKNIATETIGPDEVQRVKIVVGNLGTDDGDVSIVNQIPAVLEADLISRGLVPGKTHINIWGSNPDVDTSAPENVWASGGLFEFPPGAETFNIVSTSALDNGVTPNTGARTAEIKGLDASFNEAEQIISLNGTTAVVSNIFVHIQSLRVLEAGATGANQGVISAVGTTSGLTVAAFPAGQNASSLGHYMVPGGKTAYLERFIISAGKTSGAGAFVTAQFREFGANTVFQNLGQFGVGANGLVFEFTTKPTLIEKTQLKFLAEVLSNNTAVTVFLELLVIDN